MIIIFLDVLLAAASAFILWVLADASGYFDR